MKNTAKIISLVLVLILLCLATACGGPKGEKALYGSWYTEANGVRLTVAFGEDKVMTVVCTVTDKAAADAAGVNPQVVQSKNISCYYSVAETPDLYNLTEEEQELLAGKMAIISYMNEDDMKNSLPGETIYFTISGDQLKTWQRNGVINSDTNVPEYSETVFTKNK